MKSYNDVELLKSIEKGMYADIDSVNVQFQKINGNQSNLCFN